MEEKPSDSLSCVIFVSGFAIKDDILIVRLMVLHTSDNSGSHFFGGYGLLMAGENVWKRNVHVLR